MENINAILEKLMLNRAALLIKRFDNELKGIIESDLDVYRLNNTRNYSDDKLNSNNQLVA